MPWLDDLPPIPLGQRSSEFAEPAPARADDFNAPVVDFGFHDRGEKPIRPYGDESIFGPAGRQNNIIMSALSRKDIGVDNSRDPDDPDYTAWGDIEANDRYRQNWSRFTDSNNRRHTEAIKRQIDMETDDKRSLDAAGWSGMLASMVMGIADPTILLPGGGVVVSAKGGYSLAKSALVIGAAAGAGSAVQEGFLQSSQETRTLEESALAIGGSIILGGLLGAGGAGLLNRAERKTVESAARVLYGGQPAAGGAAVASGVGGGIAGSVGAEAASRPGIADLTVDGRVARTVAEATSNLNPTLRLNTSPLAASREFGQQLAENSLYQGMHTRGETLGPAVETLARANYNSRIFQSVSEHNDLFSEARKSGLKLSRPEFEEAVGRALRRGDEGENEFVTRAAQSWRKNLFDPFKDEAIAARLLPPDVTPEGAASYFSRVYDRERLIAREADFKGRVTSYYAQVLANEFGTHSEATRTRIAALEGELADLRMAPDQRTAALADINTTLRDLEAKNIDKIEIVDRVTALSTAARDATEKGNRKAAQAAREEITRLKAEGGADLAGFIKERGSLRSRANRVNMNYAGLAERQNKVMNQLADLEESNIRNMNRLVARGRKFEQEAQKLDPLIRDEKMGELRTAFNQVLQRSEKAAQRIADARAKVADDFEKASAKAESDANKTQQGVRVDQAGTGGQAGSNKGSSVFTGEVAGEPIEGELAQALKGAGDSEASWILDAALAEKPMTVAELRAGLAKHTDPETADQIADAVERTAVKVKVRKQGKPQSLSQFIARNGGLALDGDAAAAGFDKIVIPGGGRLARKNGKTIDGYWREALMEAGYLPKDADGYMSRNITDELYAALDAERTGTKRYSVYDEDRVAAMQEQAKASDAKDELSYKAEKNATVISDELNAIGIDARQVDEAALDRAAMKMAEGDTANPLDLYERAIMELADEADAAAIKATDDKLAKDMARGPKAVRAPELESVVRRQQALDIRLIREEKQEAARIEKLNSLARRMETLDAFNPEERMFELRRIMDELAREVSDSSLAKGEKAVALKDRYKQFDPERVKAREAEIARMKADAEKNFYDRWEGRAMGEGVDLAKGSDAKFDAMARQIAEDVFDKITGKSTGAVSAPEFITPLSSGPLKERTFNVPDKLIEDFLDSNVISVGERYGRSMASQIEMTNRFGRADMADQMDQIRTGYMALRDSVNAAQTGEEAAAVIGRDPAALDAFRAWARGEGTDKITKERILSWLDKREKADKRDLEAVRDLILGRYKLNENASDYGRFARSAMAFNYIRAMGGALLANITEIYRPAMVHGFGSYMNDGIRPLLKNLDAVKLSVKEAQLAGQVTEMVTQNRLMSLGEVGDPYKSGTAIERLLQNGTRLASKWNGLTFWTDGMKAISSVLSQHRIIDGVLGKSDDARFLAYLGIDKNMAQTIAEKFRAHGQTLDGVHIANTEKWTEGLSGNELDRAKQAVRAYRAAISKDVDSIIVTRSAADVPLFANTPTGKMLLQFRTFNMAAHQRVMLRGLQESQARFLSGMIAMTTLGMAAATMRSWRGGQERWDKFKQSASNPGYLIGEGLDMTGIFPMIFEAANTSEKFMQASGVNFNPVKNPMMAAFPNASQQGESTRFASRGVVGALAGPTVGMIETAAKAVGGNTKAAAQLVPFNSYMGPRELIQMVTGNSPYGR